MSEIRLSDRLQSEIIGPFGPSQIKYFLHKGRFVGRTPAGDFDMPCEIATPVDPAQADGVCIFEPQHPFDGSIARDAVFGRNFLFAGGASHGTVEHRRAGVGDTEILRQFGETLKQIPHIIQRVDKLYSIGVSATGDIVQAIYPTFGHQLFDLTFVCNASYKKPYIPPVIVRGQNPKRIIVFGTENEFVPQLVQDVAQNSNFPHYRIYTVSRAPHIPDTPLTRPIHTAPPRPVPIAGTTPIRWDLFLRSLLVEGHAWVTKEEPPPPSVTLKTVPGDPPRVALDPMGNALGGIRHPAIETGEATFLPTVLHGSWPYFGGRGNERTIEQLGGFDAYFSKFKQAVESLVAARFLRRHDADKLLANAALNRANTFTRSYAAGLFV